jgi:hypothetical protein
LHQQIKQQDEELRRLYSAAEEHERKMKETQQATNNAETTDKVIEAKTITNKNIKKH